MRKSARVWSALLLALGCAAVSAAEIYRSIAPDGTVSYSDRPTLDAQTIEIAVVRSEALRPREARAAAAATSNEPWPEAELRTPRQAAAQNAAICAATKEKLDRYMRARRIYRTSETGDRQYLDNAGIDAARERAASDVEKACRQ
jgi:hypothetical protein